jgi:hypothetical protein
MTEYAQAEPARRELGTLKDGILLSIETRGHPVSGGLT